MQIANASYANNKGVNMAENKNKIVLHCCGGK